ncbi:MAG: triose-phosphate isomerase [candidate division WS1 bacterium]|jgi:triosephosphate isomerase|nr:triose-phosphate isomerase [candidate division WS1 bacterium]
MRIPMMAGNWKMNCDNDEAWDLASAVCDEVEDVENCQVVLCPPFTALSTVEEAIEDTDLALGAQNLYWAESGAFTGEVAAKMLLSCGCEYVIVGHSERRGRFGEAPETGELLTVFGDNDATVNKKVLAALAADLRPIVCVGETIAERQAGQTDALIRDQVKAALAHVKAQDTEDVIIAYEPVWAIGTGEVCDAKEANRVCGLIREVLGERFGQESAQEMLVLYGGSMKPDNVRGLMAEEEIDGGLVGGASLKAESFAELVRAAAEEKSES